MPFVPDKPATTGRFVPDAPPIAAAPPLKTPESPSLLRSSLIDPLIAKGKVAVGLGDLALSGVTAAGAGLKGLIAGGGAAVGELATRLRGDALPEENPVDTAVRTIDESTRQPQTQPGRAVAEAASGVLTTSGRGYGEIARAAGVPEPLANEIEQQVPNLLNAGLAVGGGRPGVRDVAAAEQSVASAPAAGVRNAATRLGRSLGYRFRPADVRAATAGREVPGAVAEHLSEPLSLKRDLTLHNQRVTTREAGADLNFKNAKAISENEFNSLKAPEVKIYQHAEAIAARAPMLPELQSALTDGIAALPKSAAGGITHTLSALRRRANGHIQAKDITTQDAGYHELDLADNLEAAFGKQLEAAGDTSMLTNFQGARARLAKIHNVETATRAGQVDAAILVRLKKRGAPLTGRLKAIAEVAEAHPHITRHSLSTAAVQPENVANRSRIIRTGAEAVVRNIPGLRSRLNVRTEGFQNRIGPEANAAQKSYFATYGQKPEPPQVPTNITEQLGMQGPLLDLAAPEGAVGKIPQGELANQLGLDIPGPMILEPPKGRVGGASLLGKGQKLTHSIDADGILTISSKHGKTTLKKRGDMLQSIETQTEKGAQGNGEGLARTREAIKTAHEAGLRFGSDTKVSQAAVKMYERLEKEGYTIKRNSATLDDENNLVSDSGRPVFEVPSTLGSDLSAGAP